MRLGRFLGSKPLDHQMERELFRKHGVARSLLAFLAVAALWTSGPLTSYAQPGASPPPAVGIPGDVPPEKINETVGTVQGQEVTRLMLYYYNLVMQKTGVTASDIFKLPPSDLKAVVDDLAITRMAARHALAPGSGISSATLANYETEKNQILSRMVQAREVDAKMPEPTPQEIEQCYTRNTAAFKAPFSFSIRHILVSTYQEVESKPGDTLESIATKISGDASKVDYILVDDDTGSPRAPTYSSGDRTLIKPLEPGEHLLVPMSETDKQKKRGKMELAMQALKAGDNFTSVCLRFSENDAKGAIIEGADQAGRPVLPLVAENVKATPEGKYTPIFETKHGYNIMLVVKKTDEGVPPLKEAEETVKQYLKARKRAEMLDQFTRDLYKTPELKIDFARMKAPDTPSNTVVVRLGDKSYIRDSFLAKELGKTDKDMRDEDLWPQIRANSRLKADLLTLRAQQLGIDKTPECQAKMVSVPDRILRNGWLEVLRKRIETETITPKKAREFFENNRQEFSVPPTYTFCLLSIKAEKNTPEAVRAAESKAGELVRDARTLDDFKALVQKQGERIPGMNETGLVENRPEELLPPKLAAAMRNLQPGQTTPPTYVEPYIMVARLIKTAPGREATYEEAKERLPELIPQLKLARFPKEQVDELLKEANVVMR